MSKEDKKMPQAYVTEIEGSIVLVDPIAVEMIRAVAKSNCKNTYQMNEERILHFKNRIQELQKSPKEVVIVVINVDDKNGEPIAEALMPGFDWQEIRNSGEIPFARGLAMKEGMHGALEIFDFEAAEALSIMNDDEIAVVVVDHGVAEIFKV